MLYVVVFLLWVREQRGGGGGGEQPVTPLSIRHTEQCVQSRSSVQGREMLSNIGVPSIISQKTRNIGSKLVKYWPKSETLEIHYSDAGPMQPICRFQIVLSRRPDRAE